MTDSDEAVFISNLKDAILKDVKNINPPNTSQSVAIMVIPGAYNPIHKGHLAMFDKAYKELISKNKDILIYGVYVASTDVYIANKLNKTPIIDNSTITFFSNSGELISSVDRIDLCKKAIVDYTGENVKYANKIYTYPVENGDGSDILKGIIKIFNGDANLSKLCTITGYIVCGSDHIYNKDDTDKGSYLWSNHVIAIVRKDDVVAIKDAINTAEDVYIYPNTVNIALPQRWTQSEGNITIIYPTADDEDVGTSSTKVRNLYKLLKMDTIDISELSCDGAKIELKKLLTDSVYTWVMTNLMAKTQPTCKDAVEPPKAEAEIIPAEETGTETAKPDAAKTEAVSEAAPVPRVETESVAESLSEAAPVSEAVLVPSNYFISIHFKTDDQWTFYRCLMRGYLISTYIASHEAPDADRDADADPDADADADATDKDLLKGQIQRAMYNSAKSVLHADNVFHFDDVSIAEYDAIIGMITRMSRWFKFKLDQSVPRKAISSVEDGGALMSNADYFVHQLDAAFKVVDTGSEQSTMSINEFMDDLTADIDNANSSKVLAAWDATGRAVRNAAAATRRAPGAAWTATKSAANSVADAVSKRASQANATRKNVSASVDKSVADSAESFAARRRAVADASAAAAKAGGGRQVALQQMKQTGGAYKNAETFAGMMTKLKQYVGDDGTPANKPAMLADEYFERLSKVVAGVSSSRPSIFGHPLLLYLPFARAFNCVIYVYKPSPSDTDNYILKYIFRGAEAEAEEVEEEESEEEEVAHAKEVHEIHILDKNPDDSAFLDDDVESYSSRFALLVLSGNSGTVESDSTAIGATFTGVASSTSVASSTGVATTHLIKDAPVKVKFSPPAAPIIVSSTISTKDPTPIPIVNPKVSEKIQLFGVIYKDLDTTNEKILAEMIAKGYNHNQMLFLYNENASQFKDKTDVSPGSGNGKYRMFRIDTPTENYVMRSTGNINTFGIPTMTRDANTVAEGIENAFTELNTIITKNPNLRFIFFNTMTKNDYEKNVNQLYAKNQSIKNDHAKEFNGFTFDHKKDPQIGLSIAITDNLARRENLELLLTKFRELQKKYGYKVIETTADITAIPNAASAVVAPPPAIKSLVPKPITTGGTKLKIMTFNTCWEALGAKTSGTLDMTHCGTKPNTCRSNINTVIKKGITDKYDFILLQEMTSDFEYIMTSPINDITTQLTQPPLIPNLKYYSDDKYYGYHYTCKESCIGILHLQSMGHATKYFAGNLAGIPYTAEPKNSVNAGARPFIMLLFETLKLIVVNVHAPKDPFKKGVGSGTTYKLVDYADDTEFTNAITNKYTSLIRDIDKIVKFCSSSPNYAFQYVIQDAIRTQLGIADTNLPQHKIIIAGDFNTPKPVIQIGSDEPKTIAFTTPPKGNALNGNTHITCAFPTSKNLTDYKNGALSDHILSNTIMKNYNIFDGKIDGVDIPGILKTPPEFSDHLPVYATITTEKKDDD